jgi:hypothetical protein
MKLPLARVLPVLFALLLPSAALAQSPADGAPTGTTAHADRKSGARAHAKTTKKPKAKAKTKRARTPGKAKAKSGKKSTPKG